MTVASANLNELFAKGCIEFSKPKSFSEAARQAAQLLSSEGFAVEQYADQVEEIILSKGPYMVVAPQVAIVHGRPDAKSKTGAALVLSETDLITGSVNDPVRLVFAISAANNDDHIEMLKTLSGFLVKEGSVGNLLGCSTISEVRDIFSDNLP